LVEIAGLRWKNPVTVGSGIYAPWDPRLTAVPLDALGAITVKSVTVRPRSGNPQPRVVQVAGGLLNSVGLANPGVEDAIAYLPPLRRFGVPVIASLAGESTEEFAFLARRLAGTGLVDALELNLSCPNVPRGLDFGQDPRLAAEVVEVVRSAVSLPVFAKLTPNCADVVAVARACEDAGAHALVLINTVLAMAIDVRTALPRTGTRTGGLSGPPIKPVAVRIVWDVYEAVRVPIIGMGGIATAEDALEFILAGASAVAVGTAAGLRPEVVREVVDGLEALVAERGGELRDLVGLSHRRWAEAHP
jgi:dihydroorotate dehydrogenase (NAD+) catalytic subunit